MSDPWAPFRSGLSVGRTEQSGADPWAEFRVGPQRDTQRLQDLRNQIVGLPRDHPLVAEYESLTKAELASAPEQRPAQKPSDFDILARNQNFKNWQQSRGFIERAGDAASFAASVPIRALTRGQYGAGDVIGFVSPSAGSSVSAAETDFTRANPDLMWTLGAVGEVSGGIAPVAGSPARASRTMRAQEIRSRVGDMTDDMAAANRVGVEMPGFSYTEGPVSSVAKQLSETPIIGAPARRAIERTTGDVARAAEETAARYGDARTAQQVGTTLEQGLTRFRDARPADVLDDAARNLSDGQISATVRAPARDTSLKAKQAVLYERAWRHIPEEMRAGRSVEGAPRVMGQPRETRAVLQTILDRNNRMTVQSGQQPAGNNMPVTGGLLGRMLEAINNPRWTANLQTLRDMRSEIRRLASGIPDTERNTLRLSDLERLQGALTQDLIALLQNNASNYRAAGNIELANRFERSIRQFRQADRFTRLSAERLETVERMYRAPNAEALARTVMQSALNGGRGNNELLRTTRRILRPEEFSQVVSGVLREMGVPVGSARGIPQAANFSVQSFLTRWRNMSPEARGLLLDGPHRAAVDDLVRVVNRIANVEALANVSRSGTNTLNVGGLLAGGGAVAVGAVDTITAGLGSAAAGAGTAYLLSRPQYARWLARYLEAKAGAMERANRRPIPMRELVRQLGAFAAGDPVLQDVYQAVLGNER